MTTADGRPVSCRQPQARPFNQADLQFLVPGRRLAHTLHVRARCDLGRPGRYLLQVRYKLPAQDIGRLPWNLRRRLFTGTLEAQRFDFIRDPGAVQERPAPQGPARITLDALPPTGRQRPRAALPTRLTVTNRSAFIVGLPEPTRLFVSARIVDDRGNLIGCRPQSIRAMPRMQSLARAVGSGGSLSANVDLAQVCNPLGRGRYQVTLTYDVPPTNVRIPGPRGPVDVWSGRVSAQTFSLQVGRGEGPPPPSAGGPTPAPRLWLTAQRPAAHAGEAVTVTLHLGPPEGQPYATPRPRRWMVRLHVRDARGQAQSCTVPGQRNGGARRGDFVTLSARDQLDLDVDLANACGIDERGEYQVAATLVVPKGWSGDRFGLYTWTGRERTDAITVKVKRERRRDRRRDRQDQGD